ncbi:glycosyltransferase family 2 protein [Candidatus Wolfebacteria bacterium]|nr:glycosyltransferase family 2 protein [Candidatus Wolfebacteria bacterium]
MNSISAIILTYNEEINIEICLKNLKDWANEIFIVDSFSTDKTLEIAKNYGCQIIQHEFINQAQQFNWALENLDIKNDWILRLDADEYLTEELKKEISEKLENVPSDVFGFLMKRRVYFMGKWIKHGGYYPTWILRLFKKGKAKSEDRTMDEHIILLEGKVEKFKNDFIDDNKKNLTYWVEKHNNYALREVKDILQNDIGQGKKRKIYYKLPVFFRVFLYFVYRYFIRFGFLDGKEGLIFHFLQGFWYRFLVDAKICEIKKSLKK